MKKILLACVLGLAAAKAQAVVIDEFDGTGAIIAFAPLAPSAVGTSSSGFARVLSTNAVGAPLDLQIDTATNPGVYAHSQGTGVIGDSRIAYTLGGVDLTEAGAQNAIRIELANTDLNGIFGLEINGVAVTMSTTDALLASGLGFPAYGDFVFTDFAGVDFTNVNTLSLLIDGNAQPALDIVIDSIGTVCTDLSTTGGSTPANVGTCVAAPPPPPPLPAPASLLLAIAGLLSLGLTRRIVR